MLTLIHSLASSSIGTEGTFNDITGTTSATAYSKNGNITYADVDGVRIKIATYTRMQAAATVSYGDDFTQYAEYLKTEGSAQVIDGKTFNIGEYFVPQSANIAVPSGDVWEETGYYVPQVLDSWLPTAAEVPLTLSLAEMGQTGDLILDDVYTIEYEVYKDVFSVTTAATAGQYLVLTGSCEYLGDTFYPGEIIPVSASGDDITIVTATVAKMDSNSTGYSVITYNLTSSMILLQQNLVGKNEPEKDRQINGMINLLNGMTYSQNTNNVSYEYCANLILNLQDQATYLLSNS